MLTFKPSLSIRSLLLKALEVFLSSRPPVSAPFVPAFSEGGLRPGFLGRRAAGRVLAIGQGRTDSGSCGRYEGTVGGFCSG